MKNRRKIFILVLAVILGASAVLVESVNILAARHRDSVQRELEKLLGQGVHFESLEVRLLGWPGFAAKDLRIADNPRFAATPILRARELILGVQFWRLLFGRVVIDSLTLREPEFQIITDETGLLNLDSLSQRNKALAPLPKFAAPAPERRSASVAFALATLRIDRGRVIYLDRSIKEPAELQLRDIDMTLRGLDAMKTAKLSLAAALVEGLGQDVHIEGQLNPAGHEPSWLRRDMHLTIRLDSLHVPIVARAIAWLRDKIPRELDVSGPMSLQATATGTLAQPRLENIMLKAPLFGSGDYNATLTGAIEFSEHRSWEDARIKGRMKIDPFPLDRLRQLGWFRQHWPPGLTAQGAIGIYSQFEGTWSTLRVGALVQADKSEWRYKEWLRKDANRPGQLRVRVARQKNKFFFHESELASGPIYVGFNGFVDAGEEPKLHLRLYNRNTRVTEWRELFAPAAFVGVGGQAELNVVVERYWLAEDNRWSVNGSFKLRDGAFTHPESGSTINGIHGAVMFTGQQAKFTNVGFRLGTSTFTLEGDAPNIFAASGSYQLRSAHLSLVDLPPLGIRVTGQLNHFGSQGTARFVGGTLLVDGSVFARDGQFAEVDFRDLRSMIVWSASGLAFNELSLRAFDGVLRVDGSIASAGDNSKIFELSTQAQGLAASALAKRLIPTGADKFQGRIDGQGRFVMTASDGNDSEMALKGIADTTVRQGVIKGFNLLGQLLLRGSDITLSAQAPARFSPGLTALLTQPDTVFESIKAKFIVEPERIRTDNLVIATADYTITGAGWIGFDRSSSWNGLIVLSPKVTREVQKDYRVIRYLLDRRGRLSITFRVEGTVPNVKIRLDNRAFAQSLRGGVTARDQNAEAPRQPNDASRDHKRWLPDALERFLNR